MKYKNHKLPFTELELTTLLEIARVSLSEGEFFDHISDNLDVGDKELNKLRDKLEKYMSENS